MTTSNRDHSLFSIGPKIKIGLLAILFAGIYYYMTGSSEYIGSTNTYEEESYSEGQHGENNRSISSTDDYLPTSTTNQIIKHQYLSLIHI